MCLSLWNNDGCQWGTGAGSLGQKRILYRQKKDTFGATNQQSNGTIFWAMLTTSYNYIYTHLYPFRNSSF